MNRQISKIEKVFILKRDKNSCRYCGDKNGPFEFDHVYPYVKGGETSIKNIVLSCSDCNRRKHDSIGMWPLPVGYFDDEISIEGYKHIIDLCMLIMAEVLVSLGITTAFFIKYFSPENMMYIVEIEIILAGILVTPQILRRAYISFKIMKDELQTIWKITKEMHNEES